MKENSESTIKISKMRYIIIIFLILLVFYISYIYFPFSEIKLKESSLYKYKIMIDKFPYRKFDVLPEELKDEINEIFEFPGIEWEDHTYVSDTTFFKDYETEYKKKINCKRFTPGTLIYFPTNNIKWNSEQYLYDPENNFYYFPEPNSIIIHNKELLWNGSSHINIVIGKKIIS